MKIWKKDYYEKLFAKRAQTVQDYQLQILHAQEKIAELQKACNHPSYSVAMWSYRVGAYQPAHICNYCNAYLKEATTEESDKLWKQWRGENGTN